MSAFFILLSAFGLALAERAHGHSLLFFDFGMVMFSWSAIIAIFLAGIDFYMIAEVRGTGASRKVAMPLTASGEAVLPWVSSTLQTYKVGPKSCREVQIPGSVDVLEIAPKSDKIFAALDDQNDLECSDVVIDANTTKKWSLARSREERRLFLKSACKQSDVEIRFHRYGSEPSDEYRVKEYETLRREIEIRTSEQVTMERLVVVAASAIYAVLGTIVSYNLSPDVQGLVPYLWWIPVLIVIFGFARWKANDEIIHRITGYIRTTYPFYGWEVHGEVMRQNLGSIRRRFGPWRIIYYFWWFALVGSFIVAIVMTPRWPWSPAAVERRLGSVRTSTSAVLNGRTTVVVWKGLLVDEENQEVGRERGQCSVASGETASECLVELSIDGAKLVFIGQEKLNGSGELALVASTGTHDEGTLRWVTYDEQNKSDYFLMLR